MQTSFRTNHSFQMTSPTRNHLIWDFIRFMFEEDHDYQNSTQDLPKTADLYDLKLSEIDYAEMLKFDGFEEARINSPQASSQDWMSGSTSCKSDENVSFMKVIEPKELIGKRGFHEINDFDSDLFEEILDKKKVKTEKRPTRSNRRKTILEDSEDSVIFDDLSVRRETLDRKKQKTVKGQTRSSRRKKILEDSKIPDDSSVNTEELCSKSSQNEMKNHQGTLCGKGKKQCELIDGEETRLFRDVTRHLEKEEREEFREFALTYDKKHKTWETLTSYFESKPWCGILYIEMILIFLSEDFNDEYEKIIDESLQMRRKTKFLLKRQSSKDFYVQKFEAILNKFQGKIDDFEQEMKKSRKQIKLSEMINQTM